MVERHIIRLLRETIRSRELSRTFTLGSRSPTAQISIRAKIQRESQAVIDFGLCWNISTYFFVATSTTSFSVFCKLWEAPFHWGVSYLLLEATLLLAPCDRRSSVLLTCLALLGLTLRMELWAR